MSEKTWRVIPPRDETRAFNIIEFIDDDFGTHIAEVYDEDSANLIAAAPEMYKLLKDCVRVERPGNYIPAFLELKDKARELLARIDGEETRRVARSGGAKMKRHPKLPRILRMKKKWNEYFRKQFLASELYRILKNKEVQE